MVNWKFILKVVLCASFVLVYLVDAHRNKMQSWNDFSIEPVYLNHAQQNAGVLYFFIRGEGDSQTRWLFASYFIHRHGSRLAEKAALKYNSRYWVIHVLQPQLDIASHGSMPYSTPTRPLELSKLRQLSREICTETVDIDRYTPWSCMPFFPEAHAKASQEWRPWQWPYFFDARPILPAWLMPDGVPHPVSPPSSMLTSSKKKGL